MCETWYVCVWHVTCVCALGVTRVFVWPDTCVCHVGQVCVSYRATCV